jgi:HrpA-like RNA helicase
VYNLKENKLLNLKVRILQIKGRNYPVKVHYLAELTKDVLRTSVDLTLSLLDRIQSKFSGSEISNNDILIFLSGKDEIQAFMQTLLNELKGCTLKIQKLIKRP